WKNFQNSLWHAKRRPQARTPPILTALENSFIEIIEHARDPALEAEGRPADTADIGTVAHKGVHPLIGRLEAPPHVLNGGLALRDLLLGTVARKHEHQAHEHVDIVQHIMPKARLKGLDLLVRIGAHHEVGDKHLL